MFEVVAPVLGFSASRCSLGDTSSVLRLVELAVGENVGAMA